MRVLQGKWDGAMCRQCCPQNCCSFLFCLKPITMSKQRLKRRLNYLTKRFNDHAPYWQFVIWARQISILIANFNVLHGFQYSKWVLSIIVLCICFLSLILHMHVKPYKYEFQNEVDKWLLIANIIIVFTATIYSELLKPSIEHDISNIWSWIITFIILITMFGSLIVGMIYLQLWKKLYNTLHLMWKNETVGNSDSAINNDNDGEYSLLDNEAEEEENDEMEEEEVERRESFIELSQVQ